MRTSLFASTIVGLTLALAPRIAAEPEADTGTTQYQKPVTVTVYKTAVTPPTGYATTVTVTKTVTAAGVCSSSTSATQIKTSTKKTSATKQYKPTKSASTTSAAACYIFRIVTGGGLDGQYLGFAKDQPGAQLGLGQRVILTDDSAAAEPWTIRPKTGYVYDKTGVFGWATQNEGFGYIIPTNDSTISAQTTTGPDNGYRYVSCVLTPTNGGINPGAPGPVGRLECKRADGVVAILSSCRGIEQLLAQLDGGPTDEDCSALTIAAFEAPGSCTSPISSTVPSTISSAVSTSSQISTLTSSSKPSSSKTSTSSKVSAPHYPYGPHPHPPTKKKTTSSVKPTTSSVKPTTPPPSSTALPTTSPSTTTSGFPCDPTSYTFQIVSGGGLEGQYLSLEYDALGSDRGLGQRVSIVSNIGSSVQWTISRLNARIIYPFGVGYTWTSPLNQAFSYIVPVSNATYEAQMPFGSLKDLGYRYLGCFVGPTTDESVNAVPGAKGALTCVQGNGARPRFVSCAEEPSLLGLQVGEAAPEAGCETVTIAAIERIGGC
jgi:hypothetical protein